MKLITTVFGCCCLSAVLYAQDILESTAKAPQFNEFGDPLTNIIDPNGARQGDWYFLDVDGQEIVLQRFTDHVCQQVLVAVEESPGMREWVATGELLTSGAEVDEYRQTVIQIMNEQHVSLDGVRQLLLLAGDKKKFHVAFLGDWNQADLQKLKKSIRSELQNKTTTNRQLAYVFFE